MTKTKAFTKQNEFGYWVGCIEWPDGKQAEVSNAKHTEEAAMAIAERMAEAADSNARRKNESYNYSQKCGQRIA